jgi:hypothetical protein
MTMKTSESIAKLAPALVKAQAAMTAAAKSATNPHFKSKYSDLATIIEAAKPHLNANGIAFLQAAANDSTGVAVTTRLQHDSGEWIEETIYLPVPQQTPQAYGSAITYAKRYQLQSMTGLPSEDDDGQKASEPVPIRPNTATQVARDEFDKMSPESQAVVREWALEVIAFVEDGKAAEALAFTADKCESADDKLALWSQLPSNVRTALKKADNERKAA